MAVVYVPSDHSKSSRETWGRAVRDTKGGNGSTRSTDAEGRTSRMAKPAARLLIALAVTAAINCVGDAIDGTTDVVWRETGFPGDWSESECVDESAECGEWEGLGECRKTPFYMLFGCKKSCLPQCNGWKKEVHQGKATQEMTRAFAIAGPGTKGCDNFFRRDPSLGEFYTPGQKLRGDPWLYISSLGVGTSLGDLNMQTDLEVTSAILVSVENGWNVIDTASNWRGGRAEACVGMAMDIMMHHRELQRGMLFIATRAGFTGTEDVMKRLEAAGGAPPGAEVNGNCIHPGCLRASIDASLERMHLETIDLLYLHNSAEEQLEKIGRPAFMKRLEEAFGFLEGERRDGRIQAYGMASWSCFRVPQSSQEYVSLEEVVALASRVHGGPNHGFRYIQLPVNVAMPEAWTEKWQLLPEDEEDAGRAGTILEAAARLGVGVFGSAPLKEGEIFWEKGMQKKVVQNATEELLSGPGLDDPGAKLLQMARSTPLLLSSVVGHKTMDRVMANVQLTGVQPLPKPRFKAAFRGFLDAAPLEPEPPSLTQ